MVLKRFLLISLAFLLLCLSSCAIELPDISEYVDSNPSNDVSSTDTASKQENVIPLPDGEIRVHFIDVGQGDSIFIELSNGKCMLIDAGERDYAGEVISLIDCLGYGKIDYLIATHPHSDHIGGMQRVVENFDIGEVYMPEAISDTSTFINLLETLDNRKLSINVAKSGVSINIDASTVAEFVAPVTIVEDLNNCSAVLKLKYGNKTFLFTGDAEIPEEETIKSDVSCDVLKVGHHGSYTSSGNNFLTLAKPEIAVISCGKDNEYGHPHQDALERLQRAGVDKIYRTDISGTITVSTDGKTLNTTEGLTPQGYKWVLNISSKKLHTANCDSAIEMKEVNRAYSKRSLVELQELGYTLCGSCKPKE